MTQGIVATITFSALAPTVNAENGRPPEDVPANPDAKALGKKTKKLFNQHGRPKKVDFSNKETGSEFEYALIFEDTQVPVTCELTNKTYDVTLDGQTYNLNRNLLDAMHRKNMKNIHTWRKEAKQRYMDETSDQTKKKGNQGGNNA